MPQATLAMMEMSSSEDVSLQQEAPYMGEARANAASQCLTEIMSNQSNADLRSATDRSKTLRKLCWCCSNISCLSVKRRDSCQNQSDKRDEQQEIEITPDEVLRWKESFDKVITSECGRQVFKEFLKTEYSEENLLFWVACEELRNLELQNEEIIEDKARTIYEDYISILSPKEVSLDSTVRDKLDANMIKPSSMTFDEAQSQIYTLMHRDSYPRFLNSAIYKKHLEAVTS